MPGAPQNQAFAASLDDWIMRFAWNCACGHMADKLWHSSVRLDRVALAPMYPSVSDLSMIHRCAMADN